jgi:protein SCO1/2
MKGALILAAIGALLLGVVVATWSAMRWASAESARGGADRGAPLEAATVEEHLGWKIPLDLHFVDTQGRRARLGSFMGLPDLTGRDAAEAPLAGVATAGGGAQGSGAAGGATAGGQVPLVLVLAYFNCRTLCNLVLQGTARTLAELELLPGEEYRVLTVSIDPRDAPADAREKQAEILALLPGRVIEARGGAEATAASRLQVMDSAAAAASTTTSEQTSANPTSTAWEFLVGEEAEIRELAESLGFGYRYDAATDQFSHPAVIFVLTPAGGISSYIYGIEPEPVEVAAALREAAVGGTRSTLQRILLRCYHYIPALRRYAGLVRWLLRACGALTLVGFGTLLWRTTARGSRHEVAA